MDATVAAFNLRPCRRAVYLELPRPSESLEKIALRETVQAVCAALILEGSERSDVYAQLPQLPDPSSRQSSPPYSDCWLALSETLFGALLERRSDRQPVR